MFLKVFKLNYKPLRPGQTEIIKNDIYYYEV